MARPGRVDVDRLFHPSRWTLRTQLVASTVALFMAVSLSTGAIAVVALENYLTRQLSEQVEATGDRLGGRGVIVNGPYGDGNNQLRQDGGRAPGAPPPGLGGAYLSLLVVDGEVTRNQVVTSEGEDATLTDDQLTTIMEAGLGPTPQKVDLGGDLGSYLLVANHGTSTSGNVTSVTGLPTAPVDTTVARLSATIAVLSGIGLVCVALGGYWLVNRNLRPLRRVAATASRVSRLPLDTGEVALAERVPLKDTDSRTEVGQVGKAVNDMLDHVGQALEARHESELRVRQFVADASHELRTPLASIRGYAELSRREPEPVPDGVAFALDRVESEALRMTSLVDDLLLLARLDAGRPLDREPVDLTELVVNAVSDAHAASPDHVWQLGLPDEATVVTGDQARLHQVVVNLLANARTHTPPGTVVRTEVDSDGSSVRVSVVDDGPGVPDALQPTVFHRFSRGDASRSRAEGSTGLGLSIVQAVAAAHGGTVGLVSHPGMTRFTVTLPAH